MPLRVVVPVDGSEPAVAAMAWAVDFARRTRARLSVCSVVDPMLACMAVAGGAPYDPGPMLKTLAADAARFCSAAAMGAIAEDVPTTTAVLEGAPADAIDAFAAAVHADLVVLGTHARQGLALGMLGSVAATIVRSACVPAVVVRAHHASPARGPIVVATDDSAPSAAAGHVAATLASALGAPIHFVHVLANDGRRAELDALERLAAEASSAGLACTTEIRHGGTLEALIAATAERGASLLATGTHGRGLIGRLVLGSVAQGLIQESPVPVLVVRGTS